jgi:hypothetical protein
MSKTIKRYWRRETLAFTLLGCAAIAVALIFFSTPPTVSAKNNMSTPTITCGDSTQTSIEIIVTAGPTGAPAGFSLQWMTAADYAANGNQWYDSDDPRLCKGSFSGNANLSRYNLAAGESVTVNVGEFLFDNGASTNCSGALICGTDYVFRAFAHASNSLNRSDFSENHTCSTLPCFNDVGGCTLTQGYWMTHNDLVCDSDPTSPLCVVWPTHSLTLGTVAYTEAQLVSILNTPATGNGLIALAHQLIAAKLNIASGASVPAAVLTAIASADALIGSQVIPPVGVGFLSPAATSGLTGTLADYNEGATGPGHCD